MKTTRFVQAVAAACVLPLLASITAVTASAEISDKLKSRIDESAMVLTEIHSAPDKDVPKELWDRATCVIVIPSLKKAAFVFGGEYGKGLMSCRKGAAWSAPVFMRLEKGSWGLQIGAQSIDLVLLVNSERGMKKLLGNKVTLGAEASVAAGPVGRDARAATDAQMNAEILSYSRAQGLFAGINLSGGVLRPDSDDNEDAYGKKMTAESILIGNTAAPGATQPFMKALIR
jgi:lipid-binding SYLF domain-containing protein